MTEDYKLMTSATVNKSMIRKIGENQYLKIIPSKKIVEISTIEQKKITEPITQTDEILINAYPKEVKVFRNKNQDIRYETIWESVDNNIFNIPSTDTATIHSLLEAKDLIVSDDMLNISNVLSMIIKQTTLKKKIEDIREEM